MKILINTPDISLPGGVANHYKGLWNYWTEDIRYNYVGKRKKIPSSMILIYDYFKFCFLCAFGKYDAVMLNPSLGGTALKRDAIFLKIATFFRLKTIIFFHGWHPSIVQKNNENPDLFIKKFKTASMFFVLASAFKDDLLKWGIDKPVHLVTTKVDDALLTHFEISKKQTNHSILFLSRIEEYKGIFIALKAFKNVKEKIPDVELIVAGNGSKLKEAKLLVENEKIQDVTFLGEVSGDNLIQAFSQSSLYILPSYSEGMPTSVLEAMAFGLSIVSRPVGGLVDFFKNGQMGYLLESFSPDDYSNTLIQLLEDKKKMKEISDFNHHYSLNNFIASKVAVKIEKLIKEVLKTA